MSRGRFRIAARIARRDARQNLGRSLLVVALIAIPVVGLSGLATVASSRTATKEQTLTQELGSTQARFTMLTPPDPSLVQSPTQPDYTRQQTDDQGSPTHYRDGDPLADPTTIVPAGDRLLTLMPGSVIAKTAGGIGSIDAIEGEPWDKAFAGRFTVIEGHAPTSKHEIMVNAAALERLGAKVGGWVTLVQPVQSTFQIVGVLRNATEPSSTEQLYAIPGALGEMDAATRVTATSYYLAGEPVSWATVQQLNHSGATVLSREVIRNPPPADQVKVTDTSADVTLQSISILLPFVGFALFEVALLAGAAFMVGTKRQQRSLAILSSVGGDRRMLYRVVTAGGLVLGAAGGIVGSLVGIGAAFVFVRATDDGSITQYPAFTVNPWFAAGILFFAIFAGWISATIPAWHAARTDVVGALRGSVRPPKPKRRTPVIGIAIAIAGAALTVIGVALAFVSQAAQPHDQAMVQVSIVLIIVGPIALQLAAIVVSPLLLRGIASVFSRFGAGARLGSRDTARNASRSVPALAAIMSTVFIGSFLMTFLTATVQQNRDSYVYNAAEHTVIAQLRSPQPGLKNASTDDATQIAASMGSILGVKKTTLVSAALSPSEGDEAKLFPMARLSAGLLCEPQYVVPDSTGATGKKVALSSGNCQGPYYLAFRQPNDILVGSTADLAAVLGKPVRAEVSAALAAGSVVAFHSEYVDHGRVTIDQQTGKQLNEYSGDGIGTPASSKSAPAVLVKPGGTIQYALFMTPQTAKALSVPSRPLAILAPMKTAPTAAQYDALLASAQAIRGHADAVYFSYENGPDDSGLWATWLLLGLCAVISLGASSVAIGLARSDARRTDATLLSLGSPPRLRRSVNFWQAITIAGVGSLFGVVLGVVPAVAYGMATTAGTVTAGIPFTPPWAQLALAAIALPVVLALGSWATAGRVRIRYNDRAPIS